jgi:hypothetical protein
MVADALEVVGDLHRHGDEAQVAREGLLEREEMDAAVLDLHLDRVQLPVPEHDGLRERRIALAERLDRMTHKLLRQGRHLEEKRAQLGQFGMEVTRGARCAHPNLPVM